MGRKRKKARARATVDGAGKRAQARNEREGRQAAAEGRAEQHVLDLLTRTVERADANEAAQRRLVAEARELGVSWERIGGRLGITRQSAWERFGGG